MLLVAVERGHQEVKGWAEGAGVGPEKTSLTLPLNPGCQLHSSKTPNGSPDSSRSQAMVNMAGHLFSSKVAPESAGSCHLNFYASLLALDNCTLKSELICNHTNRERCGTARDLITPCMATPWTAA